MIMFVACDACKHIHDELIDGWIPACDAFPRGIPKIGFMETKDQKIKEPCNNGVSFELGNENMAKAVFGKEYKKLLS